MGIDYNFVFYVPRRRVWDVLQAIAALQKRRDGEEITLIFPDRTLTLPFTSCRKSEPIIIDASTCELSFDTFLCFEPDGVLSTYLDQMIEWDRRNGEEDTREIYTDEQGRIATGCNDLKVYYQADEKVGGSGGESREGESLAIFSFQSATSLVAELFDKSSSLQQFFTELTAVHEGVACFLDREEGSALLLYYKGQPMKVETFTGYLPTGCHALDKVRDNIRRSYIETRLRQRRETMDGLKLLAENLGDPDPLVRATAALTLGHMTPGSGPLLMQALRDENHSVFWIAAYILGKLKERAAVPTLIECLNDEKSYLRHAACMALGHIQDKTAIKPLIARLEDENRGVRFAAIRAMGILQSRRAIAPLIAALEDEDEEIRRAAAIALSYFKNKRKDKRAIEALPEVPEKAGQI